MILNPKKNIKVTEKKIEKPVASKFLPSDFLSQLNSQFPNQKDEFINFTDDLKYVYEKKIDITKYQTLDELLMSLPPFEKAKEHEQKEFEDKSFIQEVAGAQCKCGSYRTVWKMQQVRSADEGENIMNLCLSCGKYFT